MGLPDDMCAEKKRRQRIFDALRRRQSGQTILNYFRAVVFTVIPTDKIIQPRVGA
jgi:hypothetical protein